VVSSISQGADLTPAGKMRDTFRQDTDKTLAQENNAIHHKRNWKQLLEPTFGKTLYYEQATESYYSLEKSKITVALLFFPKYDHTIASVKTFQYIEMHGLCINKAAIYYSLFLGKNGAILVLSDFQELNRSNVDVIALQDNARKIVVRRQAEK
jgi:hypothetical protein